MKIRTVDSIDHRALTQVLARAFDEDPIQRWVFPAARTRARYGDGFFRWSLWRCAEQQASWTTEDLAGAALLDAP